MRTLWKPKTTLPTDGRCVLVVLNRLETGEMEYYGQPVVVMACKDKLKTTVSSIRFPRDWALYWAEVTPPIEQVCSICGQVKDPSATGKPSRRKNCIACSDRLRLRRWRKQKAVREGGGT